MRGLHRSEDGDPHDHDWDAVSPSITEAPEGDRRLPPAAERFFHQIADPWNEQLGAIEAAIEELETVRRHRDRLALVRAKVQQVQKTEQLAQADLDTLVRRRNQEIEQAVRLAEAQSKVMKKRKGEEARDQAIAWFDERFAGTRRLSQTRLTTASAEHRRLREEEHALLTTSLVADQVAMQFVDELYAAVHATLRRDQEARSAALEPWTQLRGTDRTVVASLRDRLTRDVVLPGQAFGQGPIHFVAGLHLALIEVRRGRDGVGVEVVDGVTHLTQLRPDQDVPLGLTTGSTAALHDAADVVEEAIGVRPAVIVCVSGWTRDPDELEHIHLCGPTSLVDVINALEDADVPRPSMATAARALAERPLPELPTEPLATLDHLLSVWVEDVPEDLPNTRDLIQLAHDRRPSAS